MNREPMRTTLQGRGRDLEEIKRLELEMRKELCNIMILIIRLGCAMVMLKIIFESLIAMIVIIISFLDRTITNEFKDYYVLTYSGL